MKLILYTVYTSLVYIFVLFFIKPYVKFQNCGVN